MSTDEQQKKKCFHEKNVKKNAFMAMKVISKLWLDRKLKKKLCLKRKRETESKRRIGKNNLIPNTAYLSFIYHQPEEKNSKIQNAITII